MKNSCCSLNKDYAQDNLKTIYFLKFSIACIFFNYCGHLWTSILIPNIKLCAQLKPLVLNKFPMVFYRFSIVVPQVFNGIAIGFHRLFIDVIGVLLIFQSVSHVLSQGARRKKKNDTAAFVVPPNAPPAIRPRTAR